MKLTRNSHYLYRILFTYLIFAGHSGFFDANLKSYYLGVEYFFIVSGFFIAYTAEMKNYDTGMYILIRIKKLLPHWVLSFLLMWMFISFYTSGIKMCLKKMLLHITEVLPGAYFVSSYYNPIAGEMGWNFPVWYVSELILWGSVVYFLVHKHKEALIAFTPVIMAVSYAMIVFDNPIFNSGTRFLGGWINTFDLRAIADLVGGTLVYSIVKEIQSRKFNSYFYILIRLIEFMLLIVILYLMLCWKNAGKDVIITVFIYLLVTIGFIYGDSDQKNNSLLVYLNDLMYGVYLNHMFVLRLFSTFDISSALRNTLGNINASFVVFVLTAIFSIVTKALICFGTNRMRLLKNLVITGK